MHSKLTSIYSRQLIWYSYRSNALLDNFCSNRLLQISRRVVLFRYGLDIRLDNGNDCKEAKETIARETHNYPQ